ncbi:MAG: hypothetical protein ACOYIP_04025 [Coriobacteriales bacterium]|jgi:hypothetical protein
MDASVPGAYDEFESKKHRSIDDYELARRVTAFRNEALEPFASYTAGDPFAQSVIVFGKPVPGDDPLDDSVIGALAKALESMGYRKDSLFAISLDNGVIPETELEHRRLTLRPLIELVDPVAVIAVDATASDAVRAAFGLPGAGEGHVRALGRSIVMLDDFRAALENDAMKRDAWMLLRQLK